MKGTRILDLLVNKLCFLTAGIVFVIPISICGCIPVLGWLGVFPLIRKLNSMSDSLYNKYKKSEFRNKLNIESNKSKSKTDKNQSPSLKDENNTKQSIDVFEQEMIELKEEPKKLKKSTEKTNEIKTKKKGQQENKFGNWLIRFIIIMILWYPIFKMRLYLGYHGIRSEYITLLTLPAIVVSVIISKHITFILLSLFKNVNKKSKSLIGHISIILLISIFITVIITVVKKKEPKEFEYKENQSLNIIKQKKRIAKEKTEKERLVNEKAKENLLFSTIALEKAEKERLAKKKTEKEKEKLIIKNAEYYLERGIERMKVDESGRFNMTNKDWNYVIENCNKCLDLDSDFLMGYFFRGNAYYFMGEYRKSMKDYKKITRIKKSRLESTGLFPFLSQAYIGLGNSKLQLKLNYCREYKKACDLGDCLEFNAYCK